ncbi:LytR/AlgR family response regulator transcription factor [Mangrovibacterium diazotrophicum]|uniref:LytTR family two component transcriptional regulator n=1 Tax=Mangrovibacterium diazotrophicum TaxID=1261403 RepID=A0A419W9G3_9BACT|nr:LytTR family DNA-binding domain-containing protein [Mangrovibacterium diazotrophicum]RKD92042.1 LytTR family two component transcriptional regulator [Mangrovibacterium diazotrophicum]
MTKIKCIIVDDEPIARQYLSDYVQKMPQLELLASFSRAADAFPVVEEGKVDLMFLDIQMPGLTGLEFLRTLQRKPAVILTTAYSEYALEGYELDVTDYLLKPIPFSRFAKAVSKINPIGSSQLIQAQNNDYDSNGQGAGSRDFVFVKSGYKSVKVNLSEIVYVEGLKEYVVIHTKDKKYTKLDRMKNLENLLSGQGFLRIHKSYIVAISAIEAVFGNTVELGGLQLPIGRSYKEEIEKVLGMNS